MGSGSFTMNGGVISGNALAGTSNSNAGGGVAVYGGTFTMNGGIISGNTARWGGGVWVMASATFIKSGTGGIIYGNNAPEGQANKATGPGAAVYSQSRGVRNTTARASQAIDTRTSGAAGGWEYVKSE